MPQKESRMQILWFWQEKNKTVIRKFWAEISHHYYPVQQFSLISPDNISGESQVSRDRRSHQAANIFPMDSSRSWQSSSRPGSTPLRSRSCKGFILIIRAVFRNVWVIYIRGRKGDGREYVLSVSSPHVQYKKWIVVKILCKSLGMKKISPL